MTARAGITVNAICPGYINTEMVQAVPKDVLEKNILPLNSGRAVSASLKKSHVPGCSSPPTTPASCTGSTMTVNGAVNIWPDALVIPTAASYRAGPESILPVVVMDSGLVLRTPRNDEGMTKRSATLIGMTAILMWSLLALLTVASGTVPPFQLAAMTFAIGACVGALELGSARPGGWRALRQPLVAWLVGVGGLFGYHALYGFISLRFAPTGRSRPSLSTISGRC